MPSQGREDLPTIMHLVGGTGLEVERGSSALGAEESDTGRAERRAVVRD